MAMMMYWSQPLMTATTPRIRSKPLRIMEAVMHASQLVSPTMRRTRPSSTTEVKSKPLSAETRISFALEKQREDTVKQQNRIKQHCRPVIHLRTTRRSNIFKYMTTRSTIATMCQQALQISHKLRISRPTAVLRAKHRRPMSSFRIAFRRMQ